MCGESVVVFLILFNAIFSPFSILIWNEIYSNQTRSALMFNKVWLFVSGSSLLAKLRGENENQVS